MKGRGRQARINEMLEDVHKQLSSIKAELTNNPMQKNHLWNAYAKLEYAILLAKLDHDFETGSFRYSKFDKNSETEMLELVIDHLESGKRAFNKGSMKSAVNYLRKARDALKLLLTH